MCKLCTPILALAGAGLLQGYGLAVNPLMAGAVAGFASGGVKGAITGAVGAGIGAAVSNAIQQIPGCISGCATAEQQSAAGSLLSTGTGSGLDLGSFNSNEFNNIPATVQSQGQSLFTNLTKGATEILESARGFITNAFDIAGNFDRMVNFDPATGAGEFGWTNRTPLDQITGGLSSQFNLAANPSGWTQLCENLKANFGTAFNFSDLTTAFTVPGLVNNLIGQGNADEILTALDKAGISYEQLQSGEVSASAVSAALDAMPSRQFQNILTNVGMTAVAGATISKFSDMLSANKILGPAALALAPTLPILGNGLFNLAGFNSTATTPLEWGTNLSQIKIPDVAVLTATIADPVARMAAYTVPGLNLGTGSSIYGTCTMKDIVGCAYSKNYSTSILDMVAVNTRISQTAEGQALIAAVASGAGSGSNPSLDTTAAAAINAALVPFLNPVNSVLQQDLSKGTTAFNSIFSGLVTERRNQELAGISPSQVTGSTESVIGFTSGLHNISEDSYSKWTGWEESVTMLAEADTSVYGKAILGGIAEGYNKKIFALMGIPVPDNKIDSTEWAQAKALSNNPPPLG